MYARSSKYHAKKQEIDGHTFDSQAEARRYVYLKGLQAVGAISDLELQPRFTLQEAFDRGGKHIRKVEYAADFAYTDGDGARIVEDVKGMQTEVYKLKKKLFLFRYPGLVFREIGTSQKAQMEEYF